MADIHIHRAHQLGLPKARKLALAWAEQVEAKFDMDCTVIEGDDGDTVEFKRSGVNGCLQVKADHFDLKAKLGFLLGAFSHSIEAEITKNLDALLDKNSGRASAKSEPGRAANPGPAPAPAPSPAAATKKKTATRAAPSKKA